MTAKNAAASVRQRLLNLARATNLDYNQLLIPHALERWLYRLAASPHAHAFVVKGAILFTLWRGTPHRPTQDLDLLGFGDPTPQHLVALFQTIATTAVEDDGWTFDPASITAEPIRTTDEYGGVRIHLAASLGTALLRLQVDVGFGDAITPAPISNPFPVLLDQPAPLLRTYPPATVVAEKTEAITRLGMLNTRLKDYFDLAFLAAHFSFDGRELTQALRATFARPQTPLPQPPPPGLTPPFATDPARQRQWTAFSRRIAQPPTPLLNVVQDIVAFLSPPLAAAKIDTPFPYHWHPHGPWTPSHQP